DAREYRLGRRRDLDRGLVAVHEARVGRAAQGSRRVLVRLSPVPFGRLRNPRCTLAAKDIWRRCGCVASVDGVRSALLLAEPEAATRGFLERHLRDDGFDVLGAAARIEALELAERVRPDLVLLAELDLCCRLREGEPGRSWNRDVPVIVIAPPEADPVDRVRAFERGADDVLERPFVYAELLARIRAVLRRSSPPARERLVADDL